MEGREKTPSSLTAPLIQTEEGYNVYSKETILEELRKQLWLAAPLVSVSLLQFCLQLISVMFVGHLGELPLAGASMATSFASVTGFSLLMGMASALDTLCGQSYGAKQYHMLGIHMQRAMLVLFLVCIPLAVIWANTSPILQFLGQDPLISEVAGTYARFMIPCVFGYGILQCQVRFLQTQNNVFPMMLSSGITALMHLVLCWSLVLKCGLGIRGAAVANCISNLMNVFWLSLYIKFSSSCSKTWTGFSREALHDILDFVRLAVPSAVMVCLEAWSFEMMVLLSGLLPNPQLQTSALSICLNTSSTVWTQLCCESGLTPIASHITCSTFDLGWTAIPLRNIVTRVSNELGAGRPRAARLAVGIVLGMAFTQGLLVGHVLLLIRNIWGYAYTNEIQVVAYVATMMPILAASNFMDGLQCVLSGTVRGIGWQKIGAYINLGAYYLVGFPLSILFAFVLHMGGKGLWWGITCALTVQVVCLFGIISRTNWGNEAKKAKERVYSSTIPVEILS